MPDAEMRVVLPGMPPQEWLQRHNLAICPHCGRSVSRRCNNGVHRICMTQQLRRAGSPAAPSVLGGSPDISRLLGKLPDWDEICLAPVDTRDTLGAGILPKATFLQCVAGVLLHCRLMLGRSGIDTLAHQRARLGLSSGCFPRPVWRFFLAAPPSKRGMGMFLANRLERWLAGKRRTLWDEAPWTSLLPWRWRGCRCRESSGAALGAYAACKRAHQQTAARTTVSGVGPLAQLLYAAYPTILTPGSTRFNQDMS